MERLSLSPNARQEVRELLLSGARRFRVAGRETLPYPELMGWITSAACGGDEGQAIDLLAEIRRESGVT